MSAENVGIFSIDEDLLRSALHLPSGTEILSVRRSPGYEVYPRKFDVLVMHPDLPPVDADAGVPTRLSPSWSRREPVVFVGWGA